MNFKNGSSSYNKTDFYLQKKQKTVTNQFVQQQEFFYGGKQEHIDPISARPFSFQLWP